MKQYFSDSFNNMTFTFSFLVLLNVFLNYFVLNRFNNDSLFIISLAFLVIAMTFVGYITGYFDFKSTKVFVIFDLFCKLLIFILTASLIGLISVTLNSILINSMTFIFLYYLNYQLRKKQLEQLANKINKQLKNKPF